MEAHQGKVLGMTGSPIGKRGLEDGSMLMALLQLPVMDEQYVKWPTRWARHEAEHFSNANGLLPCVECLFRTHSVLPCAAMSMLHSTCLHRTSLG